MQQAGHLDTAKVKGHARARHVTCIQYLNNVTKLPNYWYVELLRCAKVVSATWTK